MWGGEGGKACVGMDLCMPKRVPGRINALEGRIRYSYMYVCVYILRSPVLQI